MKKIISVFLAAILLAASMASCAAGGSSNGGSTALCGDTSLVGCWVFDMEQSYTQTSVNGAEPEIEYVTGEDAEPMVMKFFSNGTMLHCFMQSSNRSYPIGYSKTTWYAEDGTLFVGSNVNKYELSGDTLTITSVDYDADYEYNDDEGEYECTQIEETIDVAVFVRSNETVEEWMHGEYVQFADELKK